MLRTFSVTITIFSLVAVFLVTSGCGNTTITKNQDKKQETGFNMPETKADITGIVKSMIGNEINITQIDMEAIREQMMADKESSDDGEEKKENNFVSGQQGGGVDSGMRGGGGRPELTDEQKEGMQATMLENSLGDTKVIFPVGIPMYKTRNVEASLADVVVGSNVTVWLNDLVTDRSVAEYVIIK